MACIFDGVAHRRSDGSDPVIVSLYGPDGEIIRSVEVPQNGSDPIVRKGVSA